MGRLNDIAALNTELRRTELAKLLATGVIRLLMQKRDSMNESVNSINPSGDGLEDS